VMVGTDPIADMLTRIRNAIMARHDSVVVPSSKIKLSIAKVFKDEGFVQDYKVIKGKPQSTIEISLKYIEGQPALLGLERVSKPGLRIYVGKGEIPRVYGGLGIPVLSTSKGIMTGQKAWQLGLGGELLLYVW
jgi:small subunit ribosomal protein S8